MNADTLSSYRVFPRLFSIFYLYGMNEVTRWFIDLPLPSIEQAGFASAVIASGAAWFKFYVDGGK